MVTAAIELLVAAAIALLVTPLLALLAARMGWVDPPHGSRLERKAGQAPVPPVGGVVLAAAVTLAWVMLYWLMPNWATWSWSAACVSPPAAAASCALALLVGLADDRLPRGLGPVPKVAGQVFAALPAAFELASGSASGSASPLLIGGAVVFGVLVAINAVNVFDNADGALAGATALAFCLPVPALGGAALGFLPWNLRRSTPGARPRAYLGDAGSHFVGMAFALVPATWPLLTVPLLDAIRVACVRRAARRPVWSGDRRHLAHRLADAGAAPRSVFAMLVLASLPATLAGAALLSSRTREVWGLGAVGAASLQVALGVGLSASVFAWLVARSAPRGESPGPGRFRT